MAKRAELELLIYGITETPLQAAIDEKQQELEAALRAANEAKDQALAALPSVARKNGKINITMKMKIERCKQK